MKIHEYQGKNIFKSYGIPIQDGYVIEHIDDASSTICLLYTSDAADE